MADIDDDFLQSFTQPGVKADDAVNGGDESKKTVASGRISFYSPRAKSIVT